MATVRALRRMISETPPCHAFRQLLQSVIDECVLSRISVHEDSFSASDPSPRETSLGGASLSGPLPHPRLILPLSGELRVIRNRAKPSLDDVMRVAHLRWIPANGWFFIRNRTARLVLSIIYHSDCTRYVWFNREPTPGAPIGAETSLTLLQYRTPAAPSATMHQALRMTNAALSSKDPVDQRLALASMNNLLAWSLYELDQQPPPVSTSGSQQLFDDILAFILEHLDDHLDRDKIAASFSISSDHLTRLFREHGSCGFTEFVRAERLDRARTLLASSSLSVKEISYACGFGGVDYFIKCFREKNGLPPLHWRRQRAAGRDNPQDC